MTFWEEDEEPCTEKQVHFYFDDRFREWWNENEPLFRRKKHPLLEKAVGQELSLLAGTGAMVLHETDLLDPAAGSFLIACQEQKTRLADKFKDIPPQILSTVDSQHWQAVLKCAILRRELQLEEKRFEKDYYIPTKNHFREIVEQQLYRKLNYISLQRSGGWRLKQLFDTDAVVKSKALSGVRFRGALHTSLA